MHHVCNPECKQNAFGRAEVNILKSWNKKLFKCRAKLQQYLDEHEERIKFKELGVKRIIQENQEKAGENGTSATQMLLLLLRLRQSCCHPYLMKEVVLFSNLLIEI